MKVNNKPHLGSRIMMEDKLTCGLDLFKLLENIDHYLLGSIIVNFLWILAFHRHHIVINGTSQD